MRSGVEVIGKWCWANIGRDARACGDGERAVGVGGDVGDKPVSDLAKVGVVVHHEILWSHKHGREVGCINLLTGSVMIKTRFLSFSVGYMDILARAKARLLAFNILQDLSLSLAQAESARDPVLHPPSPGSCSAISPLTGI